MEAIHTLSVSEDCRSIIIMDTMGYGYGGR